MKIILDLCGGTGSWSNPYREAGYDVRLITLPGYDVLTWEGYKDLDVHGILAAPPCTHFSSSGARWFRSKGIIPLVDGLTIVDSCLKIINFTRPVFWSLENPVGRLVSYLGKPVMYFHPYEFGDPYTKKTCLWGSFRIPLKTPVAPVGRNPIHFCAPGKHRSEIRSITPAGFASAFFLSNP